MLGARRFLAFASVLAACGGSTSPSKAPLTLEIPSAPPTEPSLAEPAPLRTASPPPSSSEVTYRGELWSSGELTPVETTLSASSTGLSGGSYVMLIDDRPVPGTLSNCFATDGTSFTCMWQDEFGTGGLDLEFSADREQFEGQWWAEFEPTSKHPWHGRRKSDLPDE